MSGVLRDFTNYRGKFGEFLCGSVVFVELHHVDIFEVPFSGSPNLVLDNSRGDKLIGTKNAKPLPGDSAAVTKLYPPNGWRVTFPTFEFGSRVFSPSQKGHVFESPGSQSQIRNCFF